MRSIAEVVAWVKAYTDVSGKSSRAGKREILLNIHILAYRGLRRSLRYLLSKFLWRHVKRQSIIFLNRTEAAFDFIRNPFPINLAFV